MKNRFNFLLVLSAIVVLYACSKDSTDTPSSMTSDSMSDFYASHASPVQHFSFDASVGGTFTCSKGTKLTFSANSFINQNGSLVTGVVNLEVKEFVSKQDLIYNRVSTIAQGVPLISGGAYWFNVLQNGVDLKMAAGKTVFAIMPPQKNTQQMYVYAGTSASDKTFGKIDWLLDANSLNEIIEVPYDSVSSYLYVTSRPGSVYYTERGNYTNCDYPTDTIVRDSLKVTSTDPGWNYCTNYLVAMRSEFSLTSISVFNGVSSKVFLPAGAQLEIAAMYKKDNKFYLSHKFATCNGQTVVMSAFTEISEADLVTYLNTL